MDRIKALFDITKSRLYGDSDSLKELLAEMIEHMEAMQPVNVSAFVAKIEGQAGEIVASISAIEAVVKAMGDAHTMLGAEFIAVRNEVASEFLALVQRVENIEQHPAVSVPTLEVVPAYRAMETLPLRAVEEVLPLAGDISATRLVDPVVPRPTGLATGNIEVETLSAKNDIRGA